MKIKQKKGLVIRLSFSEVEELGRKFEAFNSYFGDVAELLSRYQNGTVLEESIRKLRRVEYRKNVCEVMDSDIFSRLVGSIQKCGAGEEEIPF